MEGEEPVPFHLHLLAALLQSPPSPGEWAIGRFLHNWPAHHQFRLLKWQKASWPAVQDGLMMRRRCKKMKLFTGHIAEEELKVEPVGQTFVDLSRTVSNHNSYKPIALLLAPNAVLQFLSAFSDGLSLFFCIRVRRPQLSSLWGSSFLLVGSWLVGCGQASAWKPLHTLGGRRWAVDAKNLAVLLTLL